MRTNSPAQRLVHLFLGISAGNSLTSWSNRWSVSGLGSVLLHFDRDGSEDTSFGGFSTLAELVAAELLEVTTSIAAADRDFRALSRCQKAQVGKPRGVRWAGGRDSLADAVLWTIVAKKKKKKWWFVSAEALTSVRNCTT